MPHTFSSSAAVELAVVERGGFIESRHSGSAIVLSPDGTIRETFGDTTAPILPRSCLKPIQALVFRAAGVELTGASLALSAASHSGTDRHVSVVRGILGDAGVDESALRCPAAWPGDPATREELSRRGAGPERIRMNCSGKHAAMLAACVAQGWDTSTYLDFDHPLQVQIRELIERLTGERVQATVVDGCGAPAFAVSLAGLAKAMHRIGTSSDRSPFALHRSAAELVAAVREQPWTIDGPGRPDTVAIETLGVFAKTGAEGVIVMIAPDGTTAAVKILDGSARASEAVAIRLLERAGAVTPENSAAAMRALPLQVHGADAVVGHIRPAI
ncbi:asparaginase [Microbacterium sediminicola]|uniref:asparaginase n=1 Tax=Microbacterium sediminicola TaxID=415210 RepID=UPI0031D7B6DB